MSQRIPRPDLYLSPLRAPDGSWGEELTRIVGWQLVQEAIARIPHWPGYAATPVLSFAGLAERAGVAEVLCKYEGSRFDIGSFKALGGAYAFARVLEDWTGPRETLVVATASDGNHGLSLAWGAKQAGIRCMVFLHAGVSAARQALIEAQGGEIIRVAGNYDVSTATADRVAAENGWVLIPDTSNTYEQNPVHVMAGYGVMVAEMFGGIPGVAPQIAMPTHIFLQGGCGGLAAAVIGLLRDGAPAGAAPKCIIVEPDRADCLIRSARAGKPVLVEGELDTIMAGLSVGEVSGLAWPVIAKGTDAYMTCSDDLAKWVMQALGTGAFGDEPAEVGDSGVAGLGGFLALATDADLRARLGIDANSRILCIATEGPVDRDAYQRYRAQDLAATGLPAFADYGLAHV